MKKIILLLNLVITINGFSQNCIGFEWAHSYTGRKTQIDNNFLYTFGNASSGTSLGAYTFTNTSYFFSKQDTNGNYLWINPINTQSGITYNSFVRNSVTGDFYIIGATNSTPSATIITPASNTITVWANATICSKYDNNGNYKWTSLTGAPPYGSGWPVHLDNNSNVIIGGRNSSNNNIYLFSIAPTGTVISSLLGTGAYNMTSITTDANNNIFATLEAMTSGTVQLTSASSGTQNFDAGQGVLYILGYFKGIAKLGSSISGLTVKAVGTNSLYITGQSTGTSTLGVVPSKTVTSGNFISLWDCSTYTCPIIQAKRITTNNIKDFQVDAVGNVYYASSYLSTTVGKANSNFILLWERQIQGSGTFGSSVISLALINSGSLYLNGITSSGMGSVNTLIGNILFSPNSSYQAKISNHITGGQLSSTCSNSYTWNGTTYTTSGVYTKTLTTTNGCDSVPSLYLTFNQSNSGSQTTVKCGSSYVWNATTYTTSGVYTKTLTNVAGCDSVTSLNLTLNLVPTVSVVASNTIICRGTSVILTASGANTYTWSNSVNNGTTFTPTLTTTYSVIGTAVNSCTNTAQITLSVIASPTVVAHNSLTTNSICPGTNLKLYGTGANTYTWSNGISNNVIFTPSITSTYTVIGTSTNNCTGTDLITITIKPTPSVSITAPDTMICESEPISLTGNGAQQYLWNYWINSSTSNPFVYSTSYIGTITFTLIGTASNGCKDTAKINITIKPKPSISINTTTNTICSGNSITLTASGANTYSWNGNVVNGVAFTPTVTDIYTVIGTAVNSCTNTTNITIQVENCTGIKDLEYFNTVKLYPNPFIEKLNIELIGNSDEKASIEILNSISQSIFQIQNIEEKTEINTRNLDKGIYLIKITNSKKTSMLKFIKE